MRAKLVELRGLVANPSGKLTDRACGRPRCTSQSFLIIFREGLEVVLLLAVLLGYLEASKAGPYRRPVLSGVALAVATVAAVLVLMR